MEKENTGDWDLLLERERTDEAFAILFERHKDYIYRLAYGFAGDRGLAEEITQEVFLRIFKGRRRWKPRAKFTTWVYRMTLNTSRELLRKKNRDRALLNKVTHEMESRTDHAPDDGHAPDLKRVIGILPHRQREAVVLRYFEKLSTRETAKVMGCREGTIKSHLHKAMRNLRQHLAVSEQCHE